MPINTTMPGRELAVAASDDDDEIVDLLEVVKPGKPVKAPEGDVDFRADLDSMLESLSQAEAALDAGEQQPFPDPTPVDHHVDHDETLDLPGMDDLNDLLKSFGAAPNPAKANASSNKDEVFADPAPLTQTGPDLDAMPVAKAPAAAPGRAAAVSPSAAPTISLEDELEAELAAALGVPSTSAPSNAPGTPAGPDSAGPKPAAVSGKVADTHLAEVDLDGLDFTVASPPPRNPGVAAPTAKAPLDDLDDLLFSTPAATQSASSPPTPDDDELAALLGAPAGNASAAPELDLNAELAALFGDGSFSGGDPGGETDALEAELAAALEKPASQAPAGAPAPDVMSAAAPPAKPVKAASLVPAADALSALSGKPVAAPIAKPVSAPVAKPVAAAPVKPASAPPARPAIAPPAKPAKAASLAPDADELSALLGKPAAVPAPDNAAKPHTAGKAFSPAIAVTLTSPGKGVGHDAAPVPTGHAASPAPHPADTAKGTATGTAASLAQVKSADPATGSAPVQATTISKQGSEQGAPDASLAAMSTAETEETPKAGQSEQVASAPSDSPRSDSPRYDEVDLNELDALLDNMLASAPASGPVSGLTDPEAARRQATNGSGDAAGKTGTETVSQNAVPDKAAPEIPIPGDALTAHKTEMETAFATLKSEMQAELAALKSGSNASQTALKDELTALNATLQEKDAGLDSLRGELATTREELETTRKDLENARSEGERTRGKLDTLRDDAETLRKELENVRGELETTRGELETAQGELRALSGTVEATMGAKDATVRTLTTELHAMRDNMDKLAADAAAKVIREELAGLLQA